MGFNSVQSLSCVWLFATPWTAACQASCPSPTPRACPNSCLSSWWYHSIISSSVVPFFSCLQSFPSSGSFPVSQFFTSGSQNIGASASASVLPVNIQDWFPLGWTGVISLKSKGLIRVISKNSVEISLKNWKQNCHMTQQSHSWAYTPRKPDLKETLPQCSSQHFL